MSFSKKIFSSVSSQILFIIVQGLAGIFVIPYIIEMVGKESYGIFEMVLSLVIINMFLEFGLGSTLVKYIPEYKDNDKLRNFVWSYFYIKSLLVALAIAIVLVLAVYIDNIFNIVGNKNIQSAKYACYIFAVGLIFQNTSSYCTNILKGFVCFGLANFSNILSVILFVAYIVVLRYFFNEYASIEHISFIFFIYRPFWVILFSCISLVFLGKKYILIPAKFSLLRLKETYHFLFGMSYVTAIAQLYNRFPKVLLSIMATPHLVAAWGISEKLRQPIIQIQDSALRPLMPLFTLMNTQSVDFKDKVFRIIKFQYFLISFLGVLGVLFIEKFLSLWLGEGFDDVALIVKIWFIPFILPNAGVFLMLYYSEGKTRANRFFVTINAIASFTLSIILYSSYGISGFLSGIVVVYTFLLVAQLFYYTRYFNIKLINLLFYSYLYPAIAVVLCLVFSILYNRHMLSLSIDQSFMVLPVIFIVYVLTFYMSLSAKDLLFIKSFFAKNKYIS